MTPKRLISAASLIIVFLSGCGGTRTTAVVIDRPEPSTPAQPQPEAVVTPEPEDPIEAALPGRFDTGKMWTFENPPIDYFQEAYGFRPDSTWFERARLGALRLPNCSASFVSPSGLILTNHHCARESISEVERAGESLLDEGFYASSLDEERKVDGLYVDQLIRMEDVTNAVYAVGPDAQDPAAARERQAQSIQQRMDREAKMEDSLLTVQVVELYNGGQYSAYTFRRYNDVRLVFAPHLKIGAFGGDPDNFTYPRYSLDYSFFRAYGADGEPFETDYYFEWSEGGAEEGEPVFIVGNPGTTSRLSTVAQLEFERDYNLPAGLDVLQSRVAILDKYIRTHEADSNGYDLRNALHQLTNQVKKNEGELAGLRDPVLIARRQIAEDSLLADISRVDSLREQYGGVIQEITRLQQSKAAMADRSAAFAYFASPAIDSHVLTRAVYGYVVNLLQRRGAPISSLEETRKEALAIEDWPADLESELLAARLREVRDHLGQNDPTVNRILRGRTPEQVAQQIVSNTALTDSAAYVQVLESGYLSSGDPTVALAEALTPLYFSIQQQISGVTRREEALNAELARARFALYGTDIPPDATFSLRIADGVVSSYPYNGTVAPTYTTFYGMFNRYFSYGGEGTDWDLPASWLDPPAAFDLSTPVNLVSTNDITGGNSGSPLLNRELQVVGVAFDSNIDALQNTYIYLDERGRAVSVDSRGMLEALDHMYDADRIVLELTTGRVVETEAEADAVMSAPSSQ